MIINYWITMKEMERRTLVILTIHHAIGIWSLVSCQEGGIFPCLFPGNFDHVVFGGRRSAKAMKMPTMERINVGQKAAV